MWYHGLTNHIYDSSITPAVTRSSIIINRLDKTDHYSLTWTDKHLWGEKFKGREFVMYSRIRVMDPIPEELVHKLNNHSEFMTHDNSLICKTVGRYVVSFDHHTTSRKWVLDIIFPDSRDESWSLLDYQEYTNGTYAMYPLWKYPLKDDVMINFTMDAVESLDYRERNTLNIIRRLMTRFSSENSSSSLIEGRWDRRYKDGKSPTDWKNLLEIFHAWGSNHRPIKYGQCWIFAECLTCCLRFLGIPTRTTFLENSHINSSLSKYIDLLRDENKKSEEDDDFYCKLDNPLEFITNDTKDDPWEGATLYNTKDSWWNIHYCVETYIPKIEPGSRQFAWYMIDISPSIKSSCNPEAGNKILGPCSLSDIRTGSHRRLDFTFLHSSVNSPFRLWSKQNIIENGNVITLPYVNSIVYPFYPEQTIATQNVEKLASKRIKIYMKIGVISRIDITDDYIMPHSTLHEYLHEDNPVVFFFRDGILKAVVKAKFTNEFYVQQIALSSDGTILAHKRNTTILKRISCIEVPRNTKVLSFLIVSGSDYWVQLLEK